MDHIIDIIVNTITNINNYVVDTGASPSGVDDPSIYDLYYINNN